MSFGLVDRVLKTPMKSKSDKALLAQLATYADDDGGNCYPSLKRLAEESGLNSRNVRRGLRRLQDGKWIHRVGEWERRKPNTYRINVSRLVAPKKRVGGSAPSERVERAPVVAREGAGGPRERAVAPANSVINSVKDSSEGAVAHLKKPEAMSAALRDLMAEIQTREPGTPIDEIRGKALRELDREEQQLAVVATLSEPRQRLVAFPARSWAGRRAALPRMESAQDGMKDGTRTLDPRDRENVAPAGNSALRRHESER